MLLVHSATKQRDEDKVGGDITGEKFKFYPIFPFGVYRLSCESNQGITMAVELVRVGVVGEEELDGLEVLVVN